MASVSADPSGCRRVQFTGPDRRRRTLRLGKLSKRAAAELGGLAERLNAANLAGQAPAEGDARRVADLSDALHGRFAACGLVPARGPAAPDTLGPFLAAYLADRAADAKPNTLRHLRDAAGHLLDRFGEGKPLGDVTAGDADEFRRHLAAGGRSGRGPNTVNRWMGRAGQFFRHAHRKGLIAANPFDGQRVAVRGNPARMAFVGRDDAARVLAACPDDEWRLLFALARFGGLRCPSELGPLTWADVHPPDPAAADARGRAGWIRVTSPKTAHHPGGAERAIPLFPELRPHLDAVRALRLDPERLVPRFADGKSNPHTQMTRIVRRAGLEPWPKLFQNLRSTRQTELAREHPAHVVCAWMGNSRDVAAEHYLQVTGADFTRAGAGGPADAGSVTPPPTPPGCGDGTHPVGTSAGTAAGPEPTPAAPTAPAAAPRISAPATTKTINETDAESDAKATQLSTRHAAARKSTLEPAPAETLPRQREMPPPAAARRKSAVYILPPEGVEPSTY